MAPSLIGEGRGMCSMLALENLEDKIRFRFREIAPVGSDLRIIARIE
jgi:diaminohydroxyphosphoribosylaminopyrimidine deaminase/5-amino-6-(5-phosphoribosylamino)uracil reductase